MHRSDATKASTEDDLADAAVARGRNAGGIWIIASVAAFGAGLAMDSLITTTICWSFGLVVFATGLAVRARYWRSARRRLGDATIQRARWRSVEADTTGPGRVTLAIVLVLLLLGFELWKK